METHLVFGVHAADKVVAYHPARIARALIATSAENARIKNLEEKLSELGVDIQRIPKDKLTEQSGSAQHQGIVLHVQAQAVGTENELFDRVEQFQQGYFLVLDTVEDPRNLGACIRTAESLGCEGVIIPKDKSASITPTVRKVACGAAELLPLYQVTNLARTLRTLQDYGIWIYGTGWTESSTCLYSTSFPAKFAVVMGSEGKGLRQLTAKTCDDMITIPMPGITESLNVSVATGVICGEIVRQKQK